MFGKQKVAMILAEFFGTTILAMVAVMMIERTSFPFFLGLVMAAVYGIGWMLFGSVSGAFFNPVTTLAAWTLRKVQSTQAIVYIAVQSLGGLVAWRLMERLQGFPLTNIAGTHQLDARVIAAEAIGAFIFGWGVSAALYKETDSSKQALVLGGSLFLGVLVAAAGSNALLNPAVAIGARSLSWSYVVGPLVGAVLGMNIYTWLFAPAGVTLVKSTVASPVTAKAVPAVAKKTAGKKVAAKAVAKKPAAKKPAARKASARRRA